MGRALSFLSKCLIIVQILRVPVDIRDAKVVEDFYDARVVKQASRVRASTRIATSMRVDRECIACASGEHWAPRVAAIGVAIICSTGRTDVVAVAWCSDLAMVSSVMHFLVREQRGTTVGVANQVHSFILSWGADVEKNGSCGVSI
jgi:hypothetical protein